MKVFNVLQEQDDGIQVELGNDAIFPMIGTGSLSFLMPSCDLLELDDVSYVPSLRKSPL
jgi:hypothetical protein